MPASVKVHVSKLFSSDPEIRKRAAEALGQLGAEARPAVSFLAENEQVRDAAAEALKTITGQAFGADVAPWRQWLKDRRP